MIKLFLYLDVFVNLISLDVIVDINFPFLSSLTSIFNSLSSKCSSSIISFFIAIEYPLATSSPDNFLYLILCAFIIFNCANAIATFVQIKKDEEYKIFYNAFYSEKYLSEVNLKGLEMISSDDYLMIGKNAFKAKVESYDIYDKYADRRESISVFVEMITPEKPDYSEHHFRGDSTARRYR